MSVSYTHLTLPTSDLVRRLNVAVFAFSENGIAQFSEASLMGLRLHMRGALHQHAHHTDEFVADIVETDF